MATPDACPLVDPYWAFYWPGGQSLTRFLLDHENIVRGSAVLDFGSGCGVSSMACLSHGSRRVVINDIDRNALLASKLNLRLNGMEWNSSKIRYTNANLLESEDTHYMIQDLYKDVPVSSRLLLLGDMFYDSDFADTVFRWLKRLQSEFGVRILVGDPDRHPLTEKKLLHGYTTGFSKNLLASYALPGYVTREHYGFTSAHVYQIEF
ncbi:hypothetical protein PRIPAC_83140 [Pristionchus pacificus]|uniref:ETFB lysine methyltransferase n=1 Tax=Pristionchus pacificus TaxID=54126 RepID=A0A2A6CIZ5_PRIPA|nr:hypothetical protein PRIPAC_83140 [Pristionchus pacificus]|eukprot:PDM78023.1 methyltransferase [Pristionchus pacificus]